MTLEVVAEQGRQQLQFRVEDEGIGMAPEVLDRLFQPFEQADSSISRRFGGTGLGLHISWTLAELMGGTIDVESREGRGSCFTLCIPYRPSELLAGSISDEERQMERARFRGTVLLVEDTIELQHLESSMLEALGIEVTLAVNGQDAVEKALAFHYDLVLMDMQMPVMDGIEATRTLRALHYKGAIVALTANVMPQHQQEFAQAGCDDFLAKPIDQRALHRLLGAHLQLQGKGGHVEEEMLIDPAIQERSRPIFVARLMEMREELSEALAIKEWSSIRRTAHNIKGSATLFGYAELSEQGKRICDAMECGEYGGMEGLVEQLVEMIDQVLGVCWIYESALGEGSSRDPL